MDTKENLHTSFPTGAIVKPEPREIGVPSYGSSSEFQRGSSANVVKSEPNDIARTYLDRGLSVPAYIQNVMPSGFAQGKPEEKVEPFAELPVPTPEPRLFFTLYESADDIQHTPEKALKEGLGMVKSIEESLTKLDVGRQLRKDVWKREIETLNNRGAPRTLIAVCGATGAGKSSILNAVLDDNIVPTSGMRACTAVVTEIAYHEKATVDADISFLSEAEWKAELGVLLHDLVDEEGNVKRITDLKSDAGVAWQKVHAVYPKITQEELVKMTVAQIISYDMNISRILGATKTITAKDSKAFAKEIAQYIDSKDQKRGKKDKDGTKDKGKDKEKEKPKEKSLMDMVRNAAGMTSRNVNGGGGESSKSSKEKDLDAPALWPLIRQVNVRCNAHALSTGAVLVDLPGVADANAARNNIAKDYMKKCNCIWILAPITRAVDDKTARDLLGDAFKMQLMNGNYDDHAITFIASKCDDISCSEVVRALRLEDDPVMEDIEDRLSTLRNDSSEAKKLKGAAEKEVKTIQEELQEIRDLKKEYEDHLAALKAGEPFTPKLTKKKEVATVGKKRKNKRGGKKGSPKRKRSVADDEVDEDDDFDDDDSDSGSSSDSDSDSDSDDFKSATSEHEEEEEEEATEESLEEKIKQSKEKIKVTRERLNEVRSRKKEAGDAHSTLEKTITKVQREKNAFCSLKRSEFSKDVLKEDFRTGLKDLDDSAAEERDPDNFDPTQNIRNYDAINLPVFTCSSRDYVRLKGQVKGDGEAACFSNVDDTGIPDLQKWCHTLTVASRERAARTFMTHLKAFSVSVKSYMTGIGDVTAQDREALREQWESKNHLEPIDAPPQLDDDPLRAILGGLGGGLGMGLYAMPEPQAPKVDVYGHPTGIAPRLCKEFAQLVDNCVEGLQNNFKDGLEEKCRIGAANASDAAAATLADIEGSMHWATYRATLRRHGAFRRDLNVELINPFTRSIAHSWSKVFESDLFKPFENDTINAINNLVKEVADSAAPGLKDKASEQGGICVEEAKIALTNSVQLVKETMNNEQKEISRCLAPHVQNELTPGYDTAMEERGTGSVARQKAYFRGFISENKDTIFDGGADTIMDRLNAASDALGEALCDSMGQLAEKIEVSLSVLWEGARDSPQQTKARGEIVDMVTSIQEQIQFWTEADKLKQAEKDYTNAMDED